MPILRILCYNGSLVTWTIVRLTTAEFKSLIFSVSGFSLSYTTNMLILMILYDFCLLPAQFCYIIVYIRKVVRVRVNLRLAVYSQSVRLGDKPLETHGQYFFFFRMNICNHSPYVTSSLTRGWVCRLQLLLALASAVILRSESRGTHDQILLSQIRDSSQPGGPGPRIYVPGKRVARLYCQALGSLSVASYDSQGCGGGIRPHTKGWVLSLMLRSTVSRPVCLGIKHPSGTYDQILTTVRQLRVCWCGVLSLTRGWVYRLQLLLALASAVIFWSQSRGTRDHNCLRFGTSLRRLLRLTGLRWRYSIPPPHGTRKVTYHT
jgi:hypothetical protein